MADALIDAAKENNVALVKQLIERGADVNGVDGVGRTALYWAAKSGFVECTKVLLEANADVNKACHNGWTPLHVASGNGYVECVKVLYLFGLWMKKTISHTFVAVQLLIDWKANVNAKDDDGLSPLHWAVYRRHLACVEVRGSHFLFSYLCGHAFY